MTGTRAKIKIDLSCFKLFTLITNLEKFKEEICDLKNEYTLIQKGKMPIIQLVS